MIHLLMAVDLEEILFFVRSLEESTPPG